TPSIVEIKERPPARILPLCVCGCGEQFEPTNANQKYIHGHRQRAFERGKAEYKKQRKLAEQFNLVAAETVRRNAASEVIPFRWIKPRNSTGWISPERLWRQAHERKPRQEIYIVAEIRNCALCNAQFQSERPSNWGYAPRVCEDCLTKE